MPALPRSSAKLIPVVPPVPAAGRRKNDSDATLPCRDSLVNEERHPMKTRGLTATGLLLLIAVTFGAENPIVLENRKEGTTNWLLFNYDQVIAPGRDELW